MSKTVDQYYAAFTQGGDFSKVDIADGVRFRSPMMNLEGAEVFRKTLGGLASRVAGLTIHHQAETGDSTITVYDFDMGLPTGPIRMAEVLRLKGRSIAEVDLIFDPAPLKS